MPSVLFVCTGNQFRSPMAAARFRRLLEQRRDHKDWVVESAGIWATEGQPPPAEATAAAVSLGTNLENHRTRVVNARLLTGADLIVVMTRGQREALSVEFPEAGGRIHLLSELAGGLPGDIPDPPSAPGQVSRIMNDVCELVELGFSKMQQLAETHAESRK